MNRLNTFKFIIFLVLYFLGIASVRGAIHEVELKLSYLNFAEVKNTDKKNHVDFNLEYKSEAFLQKKIKTNFSMAAYIVSYPDFFITLPQADIVFSFKDSEIRVGRSKIKNLSYLDSDWSLGVQTAFLRINPLDPKEQGRMGISYRLETKQVFAELYGSSISIPDQSPGIKVHQSGRVKSKNPWARLPPEKVILNTGAQLNLNYDVVNGSLPEILLNYQFGGALGAQTDDLKIIGMYSNRPSKQIGFLLNAKFQTDEEALIKITAKPTFLREHFFGVQTEFKWFEGVTVKNGFYGLVLEENESTSKYQTSHSEYFFISTDVNLKMGRKELSLKHLYTKESPNVQKGVFYIQSSRFLYQEAVSLTLNNITYAKIKSNVGGIYLYKNKSARVFVEGSYFKNKNLSFWGKLNLIHTFEDHQKNEENESVSSGIESFSSLDNINFGVSYVF